jgi:hypothetical protein
MPLLVALALSAATTTTPPPAKSICPVSRIEQADAAQSPRIALLGEMPPAKHILAVLRTVDGCEKPIVVNDEVGSNRGRR